MNIVISIHIFPTEIGKYNRLINDLNKAYSEIDSKLHQVTVHSTLNLNSLIINWKDSKVNKSDAVFAYQKINKCLQIPHRCEQKTTNDFMGVNEHRRIGIERYSDVDSIIFLDPDLYFNDSILKTHILAYDKVKSESEFFIITPQVVKLWDNTWDCIVNEKYIKKDFEYHKNINPIEIVNSNHGDLSVEKINEFKWGGGWFNSISPKLLSLVNIPKSFVGYGPDDTFIMVCASMLKHRGYNIQQYILKNELVAEWVLDNTPDKFSTIPMNDMRETFRYNGEHFFFNEVQKFRAKL